ncbi:MAG: tRNA (adenosine(37)-N6)-threonylcarbamoyltransferase complex dimerization subunit type 1 TsaB [Desulforhabdus sp.]|jgi:tRNA threonylcarbamoyladenosine biosynthesis protein TsaB|nr:tRNA (adenosine(37)-N6)-threonylcarbamoyltransferase complex dimerization subunit type 1 TsaB [Desulforhabdus sp.]
MKVIAVDTSTSSGSAALLDGDLLVAEWSLQCAQTHNRRLLRSIDFLLQQAGWSLNDLDGFAVATGPGSFTGLRIGLSTVKTLAWSVNKPFVGISSLDALAAPLCFAQLPVCPILDARKKEIYFALYKQIQCGQLMLQGSYCVSKPERLIERIDQPTIVCGDGWLLYRELLRSKLGKLAVELPAPYHTIRAANVGAMAMRRLQTGEAEDPMTSLPLYVRPSEAELHKQQKT